MKLVERLSRVKPDVLHYEVTIDDPRPYARPWTISIPLISPEGFQLLPYECHEGNYMPVSDAEWDRIEKLGSG
jgi:hypothetical protein